MTPLFDGQPLEEGAVLLRGFAAAEGPLLVEEVARVAQAAAFRHLVTPGGYTMSVAMTNCGRVGWVSDRTGYRYDPKDPHTGEFPGPRCPATPQLIAKTVIVPGPAPKPVSLTRDYSPKDAENMTVELVTDPQQPISGFKTQMYFRVKPGDGLEKYLAAWGHMLVASDDLIDMIHEHPFIADGGPQIQFNVIFPRSRSYRVWVQFQRKGVVNTAYFDIPVKALGQ